MEIMFEGTIATRKNTFYTSGEIPKENTEGSWDSSNRKEFVDPMEVEGPSSSRVGQTVNKGKGLARSVHIFRGFARNQEKSVHPCKRCLTL